MTSAFASRAAFRISSAASPRRTSVFTRTPRRRRSTASGAKYSSASIRADSGSSNTGRPAPSTTRGRTGTLTRRSVTSRGPAILKIKGMIVSATSEPSRATRARLYMDGRLSAPWGGSTLGHFEGRTGGPNDAHGDGGPAQHRLGHAPEDEPAQTTSPMARHDDEVDFLEPGALDDGVGGRAVPHARLDIGDTALGQVILHRGEVFLGFVNHIHLHLHRIHAGQRVRLRCPEEHQAERSRRQIDGRVDGDRGPTRTVEWNENLREFHP